MGRGRVVRGDEKGAGKGREIIKLKMRYLLKCLDEKLEGNIILKSILIFNDLKYRINKNSVKL
jgi:hypothetical protein